MRMIKSEQEIALMQTPEHTLQAHKAAARIMREASHTEVQAFITAATSQARLEGDPPFQRGNVSARLGYPTRALPRPPPTLGRRR